MTGTLTLNAVEACEALRAYLVLRGALPAHGTVTAVKTAGSYSSDIEATVEIEEPPALMPALPAATPDDKDIPF